MLLSQSIIFIFITVSVLHVNGAPTSLEEHANTQNCTPSVGRRRINTPIRTGPPGQAIHVVLTLWLGKTKKVNHTEATTATVCNSTQTIDNTTTAHPDPQDVYDKRVELIANKIRDYGNEIYVAVSDHIKTFIKRSIIYK